MAIFAEDGWVIKGLRAFGLGTTPAAPETDGQMDEPSDDVSLGLAGNYATYMKNPENRLRFYSLYDNMDCTDLICSVLDMMAENATPQDPDTEQTIWIESETVDMEKEAEELFATLATEDDIAALARETAKKGDLFMRLVYESGVGVQAWHAQPPERCHRKEDKIHRLLGFNQDGKKFRKQTGPMSYPWDYVHFRLRGRDIHDIYGKSVLYNAIRPWKQMIMAEDHTLLYNLHRTPDRNLFLIDIGNLDEGEAQRVISRLKNAVKYTQFKDPGAKDYDHRFNSWSTLEDVYIGTRKDSATRVDKMNGSGAIGKGEMDLLNYYVDKLFAALRTPKNAFWPDNSGTYQPKIQLTNQDVRYARNIRRIQRAIKSGYRNLLKIHFMLKWDDNPNLDWRDGKNKFKVMMPPVSWLEELERLELIQLRNQVTDALIQGFRDHAAINQYEWVKYILSHYGRISDKVLKRIMNPKTIVKDREALTAQDPDAVYKNTDAMMKAQVKGMKQMYADDGSGGGEEDDGSQDDGSGEEQQAQDSFNSASNLTEEDKARIDRLVRENQALQREIATMATLFEDADEDEDDDDVFVDRAPSIFEELNEARKSLTDDMDDKDLLGFKKTGDEEDDE